jgi:hypothetical protein
MNAKALEKPSIEPREPLDNPEETLNELYFDNPREKQKGACGRSAFVLRVIIY